MRRLIAIREYSLAISLKQTPENVPGSGSAIRACTTCVR
jgi:hypothetical protein